MKQNKKDLKYKQPAADNKDGRTPEQKQQEPNSVSSPYDDRQKRFDEGLSFQESAGEYLANQSKDIGKDPNSISPPDRPI